MCQTPVCGNHSTHRQELRVCLADATKMDAESRRIREEKDRSDQEQRVAREHDRVYEAVRAIHDVDDRFLAAWQVFRSNPAMTPAQEHRIDALLEGARPRFFKSVAPSAYHLDTPEIMSWAEARGATLGSYIKVRVNVPGVFGTRRKNLGKILGWEVGRERYEGTYRQGASSNPIFALVNGLVVEVRGQESASWREPKEFGSTHVAPLAKAVGLAIPSFDWLVLPK